jgi:hypothetical protein
MDNKTRSGTKHPSPTSTSNNNVQNKNKNKPRTTRNSQSAEEKMSTAEIALVEQSFALMEKQQEQEDVVDPQTIEETLDQELEKELEKQNQS